MHLVGDIFSVARTQNVQFSFSTLNRHTFSHIISPHIQVFGSLFPTLTYRSQFVRSPLALTRDEVRDHRRRLEETRDSRARELGNLTFFGAEILAVLRGRSDTFQDGILSTKWMVEALSAVLLGNEVPNALYITSTAITTQVLRDSLLEFVCGQLPKHTALHVAVTDIHKRPSRWTLAWPRIVLLPPVFLIGLRSIYSNRDSLIGNMVDAMQTVRIFWSQWIFEPIVDILNTVRSGGEEGVRVISKEGLKSDMEVWTFFFSVVQEPCAYCSCHTVIDQSLERMVVDLAMETQACSESELRALSDRIRQGDLTSVLKIYEGDIKNPLRSAMGGTLIRSLLIQVQKAKVKELSLPK